MRRVVFAGLVVIGVLLSGCGEPDAGPVMSASPTAETLTTVPENPAPELPALQPSSETVSSSWVKVPGVTGLAIADVRAQWETLEVKGRAPKTGYTREQFGQRWKDIDRNGCDQRNDVLARDLTNIHAPGGCKVLSGTLRDPFTGMTIDFVRGQHTSSAVQIDHVVPLSDAWQKGAQAWDPETRERFGNDSSNLLAVDGPQNVKKGDGDAATWLPPNEQFRCHYVAIQVRVKHDYGLWVTQAEKDALGRELGRCSNFIS